MTLHNLIFILILSLTIVFGQIDSTQIIDFSETNIEESLNYSEWTYIPAHEWSFGGAIMAKGLPQYAMNYQYNGFDVKDPLYGNFVQAWINPRFSNIDINNNSLNQTPFHNYKKDLYSRFDWYQGDYNYGVFSGVLSGIINDYAYTFSGDNFQYAGASNQNLADQSDTKKSISQNFALDIIKSNDKYDLEVGFNYRKYFAGNVGFSNDAYQEPYIDGYSKKFHKQMYFKYDIKGVDNRHSFIGQITNLNYGFFPKDDLYDIKGQGITNSFGYGFNRFLKSDTLTAKVQIHNSSVFIENKDDLESQIIQMNFGIIGKKKQFNYQINSGIKNDKFTVSGDIGLQLTQKIKLGVSSQYDYFQYPFVFEIYNTDSDFPVDVSDLNNYSDNSIYLKFDAKYFKIKSSLNYTNSAFFRPQMNTSMDTVINFTKIKLNDIFWNTQISLTSPWRSSLYGNIQYSPTVDENEFYQFHFYGHIKQELTLFKGNLNLYALGSMNYFMGGNDLYWYDEFQSAGMMDTDYYTNEPLCFSMKTGFKVGSLHMFYQIHNLQSRQFSNMQGMMLQTPLKVMGVEWYFFN